MNKRQRKKISKYMKAVCCECGRVVRIKIKSILPPWLADYWTRCKCGNWIGESDL